MFGKFMILKLKSSVRARLCKLQKGCNRLAAASDKVYQLLAHGRWFSPSTQKYKNPNIIIKFYVLCTFCTLIPFVNVLYYPLTSNCCERIRIIYLDSKANYLIYVYTPGTIINWYNIYVIFDFWCLSG
jgi:hypothetical protein